MSSWNTRSITKIAQFGKFLSLEQHEIELPDGQVISDWPWCIAPDFVNVLAITEEGRALVFQQEKYGLEGLSLAPVGGYIEPEEAPLTAAKRELLEETGYEADFWMPLGGFVVDPNRGVGKGYFYLAKGARLVQQIESDDLEEQQLELMDLIDVRTALLEGRFQALAWTTNVALALIALEV
jgi:ADP-ribose pyrophosphatase